MCIRDRNTAMQIGIRIPKVPHDVPVAKARKAATRKMMAGVTAVRTFFISIFIALLEVIGILLGLSLIHI